MGFFTQSSGPLGAQLARVERKLDIIIEHLGIEVTDQLSPRVRDAIVRGKKIEAIKLYREETGAALSDAKNTIEAEF